MLEPQSRQLLLDSLHPPPGHRLDWAVGTSYSLDLTAILTAPVAFAFSDWHDQDGRPTMDPLALLKAVRAYADRICLFCQAGKIHVPRLYQPLLANLESSIIEAKAPQGGSFHPKVWFLRYLTEDGDVTYRFLCLSRNMTFDRSWDTLLCLEGPLRDRANAFACNHPLGEFVEALANLAVRKLAPIWSKRLAQLAHEIRRVDLEVPAPFHEMRFWTFGLGDGTVWPFPERVNELLVISPFVDDGFVEEIGEYQVPMQLLSRPESLALLKPETLERFQKVWVLDDTAEPEANEVEESEGAEADGVGSEKGSQEETIPLVGLHAKVYVADDGWNAHVWTGSANATTAALGRNVEMLVQLTGKKSVCGVNAILGKTEGPTRKHAACLADLLRTYEPGSMESALEQAQKAFERKADQLARSLAAANLIARCTPVDSNPEAESFKIAIAPIKKTTLRVPHGWHVRVWPISLHESAGRALQPAEPCWAEFDQLSFDALTSFFAFEIAAPAESLKQRFVLNLTLEGAPPNRRERVLRSLLSDSDRVLRFLLLLLMDHEARDFGSLFRSKHQQGKRPFVHSMFESTLFESLVKALDCDPIRIEQVAQVVHDLSETPEGKALLPKGFEAIWNPIWEVRQRQLAQQTAGRP